MYGLAGQVAGYGLGIYLLAYRIQQASEVGGVGDHIGNLEVEYHLVGVGKPLYGTSDVEDGLSAF